MEVQGRKQYQPGLEDVARCMLADDSWTFRFGVHDDEPVLSAAGPVPAVTPGSSEVRFDAVRAVDEDGRQKHR